MLVQAEKLQGLKKAGRAWLPLKQFLIPYQSLPPRSVVHGRGMWIFRGQDIPPIMKEECYDLELYTWTKVDPSDSVS
jgi:hypothetical protein